VRVEADQITFLEQSFDAHGATGTRQLTTAWRRVADELPKWL
jgi:hypothetical protein